MIHTPAEDTFTGYTYLLSVHSHETHICCVYIPMIHISAENFIHRIHIYARKTLTGYIYLPRIYSPIHKYVTET